MIKNKISSYHLFKTHVRPNLAGGKGGGLLQVLHPHTRKQRCRGKVKANAAGFTEPLRLKPLVSVRSGSEILLGTGNFFAVFLWTALFVCCLTCRYLPNFFAQSEDLIKSTLAVCCVACSPCTLLHFTAPFYRAVQSEPREKLDSKFFLFVCFFSQQNFLSKGRFGSGLR